MAHPLHAGTPKLNALLIGKRTVPGGCRVLNVSQQGMSLQCDPDGRLLTLSNGDSVDIYLSVQHANGHNKFTIPAIVSHVDESTIDVVFHCTDPELAGLLESYRTSESHQLEASIDHRQVNSKANRVNPVIVNEGVKFGARSDRPADSRSFYSGLFILFITSLLLLGAYYYVSGISTRLIALETATRSHTDELAEVQTKAFSSRLQDGRYASLNARMQDLTVTFQSFQKRVTQALSQDPVIITTAEPERVNETVTTSPDDQKPAADSSKTKTETGDKATQASAPAGKPPVTMAARQSVEGSIEPPVKKYPAIEPRPVAPATPLPPQVVPAVASQDKPVEAGTTPAVKAEPAARPTAVAMPAHAEDAVISPAGPWVINLLSSPDKAYIDDAMTTARSRGFDAVVTNATVKGRQYWRLQITGFESMAAAKTAAEPVMEQLEEPLKIKDIWIHRR